MHNKPGRPRKLFTSANPASTKFYFILAIIILCAALIRLRWLSIPLERDEGEYAYIAQLFLQGVPPFEGAYTMKLPGTSFMYALIMFLFGQTVTAIHLGLLLVNAGAIIFVALLAKRLLDGKAGLYAAAIYAAITLGSKVHGFATHATHFVVLFALAGILVMMAGIDSVDRKKIFFSGILLGFSILMKQPGAFIAVFAVLWMISALILSRQFNELWKSVPLMVLGILIPLMGLLALLYFWGTFDRFWLFTVQYAREYVTSRSFENGIYEFIIRATRILKEFPLLWLLIMASLGGIFIGNRVKLIAFLLGFLFFSFIAVCPGLYFRPHYFILLLPAVAVTAGSGLSCFQDHIRGEKKKSVVLYIVPVLLIGSVFQGLVSGRPYFFKNSPHEISRMVYGSNPFNEAGRIAEYIESHTQPDERIMVLGSEPEVYFYARRRSVSRYLYMYNLTDAHPLAPRMEEEMIAEVEQSKPRFIFYVRNMSSWAEYHAPQGRAFQWAKDYCDRYYRIVGVADIIEPNRTEWHGFGVSPLAEPRAKNYIYLLERRTI